ncbi:SAF domain-containing protein [Cryptosporangium minutisporangium]|uniref:SAF domain-containing protein n=1 Tax=Cryptosporangium minutisporangium TaxID=113569 RepID=UPI0031E8648D
MGGPRRRRRAWVIGGAVLVLVCALGSAYWWSHTSGRIAALAVAADVPAGQVLTDRDLRTVQVAADSTVSLVPASQRESVVGQTAAVPLAAGSLLSRSMLGAPAPPQTGQAMVAMPVDAGRFPPSLTAGSTVTVVAIGTRQDSAPAATPSAVPGGSGPRWPGVVLAVAPAADGRGGAVVTLRMAAADATDVAATGAVALVERHPGEN